MSTFKVQPVYAELLMGWLTLAHKEVACVSEVGVLSVVDWQFKGGKLGNYPMAFPTDSSGTVFPSGRTADLAMQGEDSVDRTALRAIVTRRARDKRVRIRGLADWASSFSFGCALVAESGSGRPLVSGLRAVYKALGDIWSNCATPPRSTAMSRMRTFVRETTLASACASFLDVPTCEERITATFSALEFTRLAAVQTASTEFRSLLRHSGSREARTAAVRHGRVIIAEDDLGIDEGYSSMGFRRMVVAGRVYHVSHGVAFTTIEGSAVALSRSDIVRVHQFLTGAQSGLFATVSQACVAPGPEREAAVRIGRVYEAQVSRLLEGAPTLPLGDEVMLCKAYKRAFGAFIGELAGPLCVEETHDLWAEALATKGAGSLDLHGWVGAVREWSASTAFNLGKVYKLCPAPDANPGLTLLERHEMVCNHNVPDPDAMGEFASELKAQILRAYIRKPGVMLECRAEKPAWWAAYRARRFDEVPSDSIDKYLAWEGTAMMPTRSPDNPAVWKDSGLGWDDLDVALDPERPRMCGNMLMRMVFDSSSPMPGTRHTGHSHDQKVDIKPEGHKDPARAIYSGNLKDRLNQSWMEAAVHEVAVNHPSFMVGADVELRDRRVRAIVERPHDPDLVALFYSFDVSGWSPNMCPEVQHASHKIWGDLHDEQMFRSAHQITDGSRVYMNKAGFTGWYINPGTNFEGYNGKEMTMLLITLMSLAVKDWRRTVVRRGIATEAEAKRWSATLLAYIDDGLAKLILPKARAVRLFTAFKQCSEARFQRCGFTVERSKCYPSDRFSVFLNEPYLAGRHVVHGTRAAMTICAENTEEHTSLVERVTAVSTGCRGAVMSGLDATAGVMLQGYHVFAHIKEWIRNPEPVIAAVWYVTPRAWGGMGMPTALQLGTSGSGSAMEESIRTLQRWTQINATARWVFLARAKARLAVRNPTGVMLAPLGGRTHDGSMVETRVPDAVRSALVKLQIVGKLSRLARDFLQYASPDSLDTFASAVVPLSPGSVVQEQLLADLASSHPHSIFSSFARRIEKSTTLMQLVGQREIRRIIKANRDDVSASYAATRQVLTL